LTANVGGHAAFRGVSWGCAGANLLRANVSKLERFEQETS
jgi:hypothetical protein